MRVVGARGSKSVDRPVRVMHLIYSLEFGGAQKMIGYCVERINRSEFDQSVCALVAEGPMADYCRSLGVKVYCLNKRKGFGPRAIVSLTRLLRELEIDLLHTHEDSSQLHGTLAALLAKGIRIVRTKNIVLPEPEIRIYRFLNPILNLFTAKLIAVSDIVKHSHRRVDPFSKHKYVTVWNAVARTEPVKEDEREKWRKKFGIEPSDRIIGFVGRLHLQKGLSYLVEAVSQICRAEPDARIMIVGEGPFGSTINKQVSESRLGDRILFTGQQSNVPAMLSLMEIFILPSLWEALPLALLEAMESGRPVITTPVGGIRDVVEQGVNGILIPQENPAAIAEAVIRLLRDKALAHRIAKAGQETVRKRFSVEQQIESTESIYREVMQEG